MITINLNLSDGLKRELEARLRDGPYSNIEDYVRDLIASDLEEDWMTPEIAAAIDEGEASGVEPHDMQSIIAEARAKFRGE